MIKSEIRIRLGVNGEMWVDTVMLQGHSVITMLTEALSMEILNRAKKDGTTPIFLWKEVDDVLNRKKMLPQMFSSPQQTGQSQT